MAVSLAQLSHDVSQRRARASTLPPSMSYSPEEMVTAQIHEQRHNRYSMGSSRYYPNSATSAPQYYEFQPFYQSQIQDRSSIYQQSPTQYDSPVFDERLVQSPPPDGSMYSDSAHSSSPTRSSSNGSTPSDFSRSSIEPDPLPPHSNPQALTQSQSHAFTGSQPIPAVRLGKDEVWNTMTGIADFRIFREAAHLPSFMSTKPVLTVTKTYTGVSMGKVRFHALTSNNIEVTVNDRKTSISHSGMLHNRWGFESTAASTRSEKWYWKQDKSTGGAMLEDSKRNGHVIARMKGDMLTFERGRLCSESYDEIVVSAVAMAEAARRQKRKSDIVDIASAIGDFTGTDGHTVGTGAGSVSGVTCGS